MMDNTESKNRPLRTPTRPLRSHEGDVRRGPLLSQAADGGGGIEQYRPTELPDDPRERAQMLREFEQRASAYLHTKLAAEKAQRDGDPMRNKGTRRFARHFSRPLAEYIDAEAQRSLHKPGTRYRWRKAFDALGAEALAQCTIEAIVSALIVRLSSEERHQPVLATKVSREIGHRIARAVQIAEWARLNPALFTEYERRLDAAGATPRHRETVLAIGLNKKARNPETASDDLIEATAPWPEAETAAIGQWLLYSAVEVTKGAITLRRRTEGNRKGLITAAPNVVELAPKAINWLKDAVETQALRATTQELWWRRRASGPDHTTAVSFSGMICVSAQRA